MARFTIDIQCDNAAFDPPRPELARILRHVVTELEDARLVESGAADAEHGGYSLRDINGNRVGAVAWSED